MGIAGERGHEIRVVDHRVDGRALIQRCQTPVVVAEAPAEARARPVDRARGDEQEVCAAGGGRGKPRPHGLADAVTPGHRIALPREHPREGVVGKRDRQQHFDALLGGPLQKQLGIGFARSREVARHPACLCGLDERDEVRGDFGCRGASI